MLLLRQQRGKPETRDLSVGILYVWNELNLNPQGKGKLLDKSPNTMALTDDSTTSSGNTGGIASALTTLNSASSNMYVICSSDWRSCPVFAVIAWAMLLLHGWNNRASLLLSQPSAATRISVVFYFRVILFRC